MDRSQIEALKNRTVKATGGHLVALCDALLSALDAAERDSAHEESQGGGHPFQFGWKTKGRVVVAAIDETAMP